MKLEYRMPMHRYLVNFVRWRENVPEDEPYAVNIRSSIGIYLASLFTGKMRLIHNDQVDEKYDSHLDITFTPYLKQHLRLFMPPGGVHQFNRFVYNIMLEHLCDRINEAGHTRKIKDVIEELMEDIECWGDVDFHTIQKAMYRRRKALGQPIRRGQYY